MQKCGKSSGASLSQIPKFLRRIQQSSASEYFIGKLPSPSCSSVWPHPKEGFALENQECSLSGKTRNVPQVGKQGMFPEWKMRNIPLCGKQGMFCVWKTRNVPCMENEECSMCGKQGIQSKEIKAKKEAREEGIFQAPKLNLLGDPSLFLKGGLRKIISKVFSQTIPCME